MSGTRLYRIWGSMLARCGHRACSNPSGVKYYIEKGITVCPEWRVFPAFAAWAMANGYSDDLTIDRENSDADYYPGNCRWVSMKENLRSRGDRKLTMDDAVEIRRLRSLGMTGTEVAERYGVERNHVYRICAGGRWAE